MDQEQVQETLQKVYEVLATYGIDVVGALVIIVVGFMVAGWARRALERTLGRSGKMDATLVRF
ncbi:MAG: mechanosensitive ion channel family protein, partial [Alphaproteobacteria bacterium]|nr:mechanosensitive ion channel family protein [Alphaproteobacteria bacterium]